jgi:hypothetical protein
LDINKGLRRWTTFVPPWPTLSLLPESLKRQEINVAVFTAKIEAIKKHFTRRIKHESQQTFISFGKC